MDESDRYYACEAFPPDTVVDSLGAGDTFVASTIYAVCCRKFSIGNAITFANRVAGAKVGFYGYDQIGEVYKRFIVGDEE